MANLAGWSYRKSVALSRVSGAVVDHQMVLKVYYGSGTDGSETVEGRTAGKVYCGSKCKTDFSDVRVTTSDGTTLLNIWLESKVDSNYAIFHIKFDSIGTGATNFYVYYGKVDASSVSDIANTFIFGDDFERGSDTDEAGAPWTEVTGIVEISTGQKYNGTRSVKFKGSAAWPTAQNAINASDSIAIRLRVYKENAARFDIGQGSGAKRWLVKMETDEVFSYYIGSSYVDIGVAAPKDVWCLLELCNFNWATGTFDVYLNGAIVKSGAVIFASTAIPNIIQIEGVNSAGDDDWVDDFIIRSWLAVVPAWGAWGEEEDFTPPVGGGVSFVAWIN